MKQSEYEYMEETIIDNWISNGNADEWAYDNGYINLAELGYYSEDIIYRCISNAKMRLYRNHIYHNEVSQAQLDLVDRLIELLRKELSDV